MRIAVVLDIIGLSETGSSTRKILLFEVEEELITALDEDIISIADMNWLCLWLLGKRVGRLYCDGLTRSARDFLDKSGIEVSSLKEIKRHPILEALLLKGDKKAGM